MIKKMSKIVSAIKKAVYNRGASFGPGVLSMLHKIIGDKGLFYSAMITMPSDTENHFPDRKPLYLEVGEDKDFGHNLFKFDFEDAVEIYHLF